MKTPRSTKAEQSAAEQGKRDFTVPSTTGRKFIASAVRVIKALVLCIAAVAPVACIHMTAAQATNCVRCQDV